MNYVPNRKHRHAAPTERSEQLDLLFQDEDMNSILSLLGNIVAKRGLSDNVHLLQSFLHDKIQRLTENRPRRKFTMIYQKETDKLLQKIFDGDEKHVTLKVWTVASCYVKYNDGRIDLTRQQLAKKARVDAGAVSRAMVRLEGYGAITRIADGRGVIYWIHPNVGWSGHESKRQERLAALFEEGMKIIDGEEDAPHLGAVN